jgi:hypothetical protein
MTKLPGILTVAAIAQLIFSAAYLVPSARGGDATARPGAMAPAFTASNIAGQTVGLSNYTGKTVIIEWTNDGCPFVGKHYNSGNMQTLQKRFTAAGDILNRRPGRTGSWFGARAISGARATRLRFRPTSMDGAIFSCSPAERAVRPLEACSPSIRKQAPSISLFHGGARATNR